MLSNTMSSRAARLASIWVSSLIAIVTAQSVPGASLFVGNGAPGAAQYQLVDDYQPSVFFNKFNFYSSYDPTYGHVQYVNESVADRNGYATVANNSAILSVDTTNKWPRGGPGRPALRIISDNTYTHGLFILDLEHMPYGCGTWPAYWLLGPNWPNNGEIDIIEGVNTIDHNSISMHTSPGCTLNATKQSGHLDNSNCDSNVNGNSGCGTSVNDTITPNNYGSGLNSIGGGVYATEWTSNYVQHWYFPRGSIPASITNGAPDVSKFGEPVVNAQGNCNIDAHFANMSIIINTDFCGAWAGQVYQSGYPNCPQNASAPSSLDSCVDYVGNNPSAFKGAYWEINSIRVYQMPLAAKASSSYTTSLSAATGTAATTNTVNHGMGATTSTLSSSAYTGPLSSATTSTATSPATATATPILCPNQNNTVWTDYSGHQYKIMCNSDHRGDDLASYTATSFENCLEICDTVQDCGAVTYVGGNGAGNCYTKKANLVFVYSGSSNAAIRVAGAAAGASPGSTSLHTLSNSPRSLAATSTSAVTSATVIFAPSGTSCPAVDNSQVTDSNGVVYNIHCGQDVDAGASASQGFSEGEYTQCFTVCDSRPDCNAFSWNPYPDGGGVCYFKATTVVNTLTPAASGLVCAIRATSPTPAISSRGLSSSASASATSSSSFTVSSSTSIVSSSTPSSSSFGSTSASSSVSYGATASATTTRQPQSSTSSRASSVSEVVSSMATSSSIPLGLTDTNGPKTSSAIYSISAAVSSLLFSVQSETSFSSGLSTSLSSSTVASTTTSEAPVTSTAPPCPESTESLCSVSSAQITCSSTSGQNYDVGCGVVYEGTVIDTSGVSRLRLRATEPTYQACQGLCDKISECVAFNYIGTNCTLLSSVTGTSYQQGAIGGAVVSSSATITSAVMATTTVSATTTAFTATSTLSLSSGATVTFIPTATVTSILPDGGSYTSGSSGSYYVYTTSNSATESSVSPPGSVSVCFTCALTPVLTSGGNPATSSAVATATFYPSTCGALYAGSGTTTIFTTTTVTNCASPLICPASGYIVGSGPSQTGNLVITTTNDGGQGITYTQLPTRTSVGVTSGSSPSSSPQTSLPVCPFSNGQPFTAPMGNIYDIECDVVFTDDTLSTQNATSLATCINACEMWNFDHFYMASECLGVSYDTGSSTNNCLLKVGTSRLQNMPGFGSGRLTTPYRGPPSNGSMGIGGDGEGTSIASMIVVPTYVVSGGSTVYATVTAGSGTGVGTGIPQTIVQGESTVVSTAVATSTAVSLAPSTIYGTSTAVSTVVSNGVTLVTQIGVTTAISVSYAPASTNTVTTTTISISVSERISTATATATIVSVSGQVSTLVSNQVSTAFATETVVGPTVTASVGGGSGGGGGVVTVTQGGGGSGGIVTVTAPAQTVTSYALPPSASSSIFTCLTYSTNYLPPGASNPGPYKRKKRSIFDMDGPEFVDVHRQMAMPAARPRI